MVVLYFIGKKEREKITPSVSDSLYFLVPEDGNDNVTTKKEKTHESDLSCYLPLLNLRLFFICYTNARRVTVLF